MSRYVEIYVAEVIKETDSAFLIETEDGEEEWIPFSQCEDPAEVSEGDCDVTISVTRWICDQKGIGY